ncbi:phenylalanine--tRNA ligase subunit alpha [candidate division KSB1 bacterium]|nr:phenylalanine--tRNA ligase subunit alpha [candidate division KSB1 bacterium]
MSVETLKAQINTVETAFKSSLEKSAGQDGLEALRIQFLGRKGALTDLFKLLGSLPAEEKRLGGQALNQLKNLMNQQFQDRMNDLGESRNEQTFFDFSLPGDVGYVGRIHPISTILREIKSCFTSMGFSVRQGPEVETEYYNFDALNISKGHPARDMQDTLFIDESNEIVLRTHTSPVQVHVMESQAPPVRIIAPGRCYRRDTPDATHSPVFHQVEGLCVDEGVSFADLKGVIQTFAKRMFGSDMKIRFRPSFFPFTEPSAEYDFSCMMCKGKGCRVCSGTGWVEISGAGMVNPAVFKSVGYDPEKYTGYAFGMGVERIAMLVYEVHDIRLFYENDMRFLKQF